MHNLGCKSGFYNCSMLISHLLYSHCCVITQQSAHHLFFSGIWKVIFDSCCVWLIKSNFVFNQGDVHPPNSCCSKFHHTEIIISHPNGPLIMTGIRLPVWTPISLQQPFTHFLFILEHWDSCRLCLEHIKLYCNIQI